MGGAVDDIENGVEALALISTSKHLFLYPHIPYPSVGQSVPAERRGGALPSKSLVGRGQVCSVQSLKFRCACECRTAVPLPGHSIIVVVCSSLP